MGGAGNVDVDPRFADPAAGDYRLTVNSPMIGAGDSTHPLLSTTDLDGYDRIIDTTVDLGPYEYGECPVGEVCGPANVPPSASFAVVCTVLACTFHDTSTDIDGAVASWAWRFGDGNSAIDQHPAHGYGVAGSYTATLTVVDEDGATSAPTARQITVGPPTADLSITGVSPATVGAPSTQTITITGTGFGAAATASLSGGSGPISLSNVTWIDPTTLSATVTVKNGGPRKTREWDVTVISGGASVTLSGGITVQP